MPSPFNIVFPPAPTFTEVDLPSLEGKVIIITGAASGVGFQLAKILYAASATAYIAARSQARCDGAIEKLKAEVEFGRGKTPGRLESMVVDLADLRTIKKPVEEFLRKEKRLDVLVNNAAVMQPPIGSKDPLGRDLETSTNCLGPYFMTLLLEPILVQTAAKLPPYSVRIVWVTSMLQVGGIPADGMKFDTAGTPEILFGGMNNYMQGKAGVAWLAAKFAKDLGDQGVLSVSVHPGLIKTDITRSWGNIIKAVMGIMAKPAIYGAYTELFAGFSPSVKQEHNGGLLTAWGRISALPESLIKGLKSKAEGGSGVAEKFFEYCDREIKEYR